MKTSLIIGLLSASVLFMAFTGSQKEQQSVKKEKESKDKGKTQQVSYKKDVAPIFKKYCLPCHTEDQYNPSELYLDTYENIMAGGKHGKPLNLTKADSSLMIKKISLKPPFGDPMPLKRKTEFPADTLKILKLWIEQGAKDN